MRVIKGRIKGRKFPNTRNLPVRPTTDFAKEGLFNILENKFYIPELKVLDAFAGTGNVGIEFLSRGAPLVWFVEENKKSIEYIHKFLQQTPLKNANYQLFAQKIETFLQKQNPQPFDLIFLDPPYDYPKRNPLILKLYHSQWLKPQGIIIMEHRTGEFFKNLPGYKFTRKYGSSSFSFFEKKENS